MKRNEKKVPGFDEIIFENRNREYGAYDLRKRYKSVTSLSILGTVALSSIILILFSFKPDERSSLSRPGPEVIVRIDNFTPEKIIQPEQKMPPELLKTPKNVVPEVVEDTSVTDNFIPVTDELIQITVNGDVNDTSGNYVEVPVDVVPVEPTIYIKVEEDPEFPGGPGALLEFIRKNTVYPPEAVDNNIEGRVILKFVVNPDGSVGRIEILKGVDPLLNQEAIRVVGILPKFRPGKQNGAPVPVWYSVPVLFRLER